MPKLVDHEQRRRDLAEAVWRVIRRDGIDRASVRTVAREAGWSAGALRHYFGTQSELLGFAMQLVVERVEGRIAALEPPKEPREAVEQLLHELLPLDDERRAENEVFFAFTGRALVDAALRTRHEEVHDALRAGCTRAVETLATIGPTRLSLDTALEAERLHALIDGLALHNAIHPGRMPPERIVALLARHLDSLDAGGPTYARDS
jgi:AcrR family transcriptional regulator